MTNFKRRRLVALCWVLLVLAYVFGVAAAWTGTKTDAADSLAITALLTVALAVVVGLASMDG